MTKLSNPVDQFKSIIPPIVNWLGYGGLLPFVALAVALWVGNSDSNSNSSLWREALVSYGAVILSFVGALHWGFAMTQVDMTTHQRTHCFVWSVVPALMAWVALLMTPKYAISLLVTGFLIHFWQDRHLVKVVDLPAWYLPLRLKLTFVACAALLSGYFS